MSNTVALTLSIVITLAAGGLLVFIVKRFIARTMLRRIIIALIAIVGALTIALSIGLYVIVPMMAVEHMEDVEETVGVPLHEDGSTDPVAETFGTLIQGRLSQYEGKTPTRQELCPLEVEKTGISYIDNAHGFFVVNGAGDLITGEDDIEMFNENISSDGDDEEYRYIASPEESVFMTISYLDNASMPGCTDSLTRRDFLAGRTGSEFPELDVVPYDVMIGNEPQPAYVMVDAEQTFGCCTVVLSSKDSGSQTTALIRVYAPTIGTIKNTIQKHVASLAD